MRTRAAARFQMALARRLVALPGQWPVRLSRQAPVRLDGLTLDPQLQLLLTLRRVRRLRELQTMTPVAARQQTHREAAAARGRPDRVHSTVDLTIPGPGGPLPARLYRHGPGEYPLLVFLHGGGFVIGDLDTHDGACRLLCRHGGMHVLAVDYRLAPEHPFPAAVDDARAALRWAREHTDELGAVPDRIAIGGDSAGANLSTVVSQLAAADGEPQPALQVLIYPPVDRTRRYPSRDMFGVGFFLTGEEMQWFQRQYTGHLPNDELADPRISPLCAADLTGLAPAYVVTAGFDPLRDEGEAYAVALAAAGVPVTTRHMPGMIHGFLNMTGVCGSARSASIGLAREVGDLLRGQPE